MELETVLWFATTFIAGVAVGVVVGYLRLAQWYRRRTGRSLWQEARHGR